MGNDYEIAAVVLAAGYSSRAPGFKPLLPMGEGSVIGATVQNLRRGGVDDVAVVVGHRAGELIPELDRLGVRHVLNRDYDKGMFSSVVAGTNSLSPQTDAFFLLPGDMSLVRPQTVRSLRKAYERTNAEVIYPVFRGLRGHPPLISKRLSPEITSWAGPGGLRGLLARHETEVCEIETADEGILLDIDEPDDYRMISERFRRRDIPAMNECEALLAKVRAPESLVLHGKTVARVAQTLAERLNRAGLRLDVGLVAAAGMLHDLAKGRARHERLGARLLSVLGYREVAAIVAVHRDIDFAAGQTPNEAALVHLADKLVKNDRLVSLDERFRDALEKFTCNGEALPEVRRRLLTAQAIGNMVECIMGMSLEQALAKDTCR